MVTAEPPNNTASTISRRPMGAGHTGNDSIEAGGLPDCELNCEKISRWTTKLRFWKYIWIKLGNLYSNIQSTVKLLETSNGICSQHVCVEYHVVTLPSFPVVGNNHVETTLKL